MKGTTVSLESRRLLPPPHLGESQTIKRRKQCLPTKPVTLRPPAENIFAKYVPFIDLNFPVSIVMTN